MILYDETQGGRTDVYDDDDYLGWYEPTSCGLWAMTLVPDPEPTCYFVYEQTCREAFEEYHYDY